VTAGENYFFAIGVCLAWVPPVQACANDVKLIQDALSSRLPLTTRHIRTLLGPEATYPAVIAGFAWLQNAAVPQDTVIISLVATAFWLMMKRGRGVGYGRGLLSLVENPSL